MTEVADPAMRPAVDEWFAEAHSKDLLAVPGVVAAMRLEAYAEFGTGVAKAGRYMNLYLLDEDPVKTVAEILRAREGLGRTGHVARSRRRVQRPLPEPPTALSLPPATASASSNLSPP